VDCNSLSSFNSQRIDNLVGGYAASQKDSITTNFDQYNMMNMMSVRPNINLAEQEENSSPPPKLTGVLVDKKQEHREKMNKFCANKEESDWSYNKQKNDAKSFMERKLVER